MLLNVLLQNNIIVCVCVCVCVRVRVRVCVCVCVHARMRACEQTYRGLRIVSVSTKVRSLHVSPKAVMEWTKCFHEG